MACVARNSHPRQQAKNDALTGSLAEGLNNHLYSRFAMRVPPKSPTVSENCTEPEGIILAYNTSIFNMVGEAGIEPTTPGLEGRCSIRLSYSPAFLHCSFE